MYSWCNHFTTWSVGGIHISTITAVKGIEITAVFQERHFIQQCDCSLIKCWNTFVSFTLTEHKWHYLYVLGAGFCTVQLTPPEPWNDVNIHFLLITSFWCLWLLWESEPGQLILEYIINYLHIISFVLIIFVWWDVSLDGDCCIIYPIYRPRNAVPAVFCCAVWLTVCTTLNEVRVWVCWHCCLWVFNWCY